jgi:hypothetical protein
MADKPLPSKPESDMPVVPSRARGSVKGEAAASQRSGRARLKLKPAADEQVKPPHSKRPVKPEGRELRPRSMGRENVKPTESSTGTTKQPSRGRGGRDELPDQVAARRRRGLGGGNGSGRYVRFRVRVEDGEMSIVDSHLVDSALLMPPTIHGEYAYEVTDGTRLLHADTIPDLGVVRAFSDPNGTREQRGHHTYRESTYEFDVRVPAEELTPAGLPKIAVVLYRAKERAPTRTLTTAAPLGAQFERELREVTRVSGIPRHTLPSALRGTPKPRSTK